MALLPNVSDILAKMYTDRMAVSRYPEGAVDDDGALVMDADPAPVPGMEAIPCRCSLGAKDSPVMGDDANPTDIQPTIICRPAVALKSGDYIKVQRLVDEAAGRWADLYEGNIGRPHLYGSSLQVQFRDKGKS